MKSFTGFSMLEANPETTVLNLKSGIKYVMLLDKDKKEWLAKICSINNKQTATPANTTTAMLLYLLSQDEKDGILLKDFITLVKKRFEAADEDILWFLEKIDNPPYCWLELNRANPDAHPDPAELFTSREPREPWEGLDINWGKPPISGSNTIYNTGNTVIAWTAPRGWP
jgi:hypothetical protein